MSREDTAPREGGKTPPFGRPSWEPDGAPDPLSRQKHGHIGQAVSRLDGPLKVKGEARYAAEVPFDAMLYAALVTSTVSRGKITYIDTLAAEEAPGVALVMTYKNAPRMETPKMFGTSPKAAGLHTLPILQDEEIHWNGQTVAVVLAESQEQADHAASLIEVAYQTLPTITDFKAAKTKARFPDSIMGEPADLKIGEAETALKSAPVRIDATYSTPRHTHNAIELHAVTVAWDGDSLEVHDASQLVTATAGTLAQMFGLRDDQVRVYSPYVGGGFGGKCLWDHQILAAAAARLARRPVRLCLPRDQVYRLIGGRTCTEQRVALGATREGKLTALIHTGVAAMTKHNSCPEQFTFPARHLYAAEAIHVSQKVADLDMTPNSFMRAPGESVGTFALESALDELAYELKMDPIELRRRIEPEKDPTTGNPFSSRALIEAYRRGAERFGWSKRNQEPRGWREGEWLIGMGVATGTYPYYRMDGGKARITLTADGHAVVAMAMQDMGMGTATAQAQHCADRLGLPLDKVTFAYGDSDLPQGTVAGGSSQTATIGGAVIAAHRALIKQLLPLIGTDSPLAGAAEEALETRDGGLGVADDPDRFEPFSSILSRAGREAVTGEAAAAKPSELDHYSMHSTAAQFAEARVNAITGEIRISRFLGSFDCGRILNPKIAASQFRGGIIMGLGLALMEETQFDPRQGRVMNPSLTDYHVPVHLDVPEIDVMWTDSPDPRAPMGARGIGEIGITGVGAAIANAVFNATGKRIRDLPITLDKLL
jgi:xanthine dehydrogenase YagR molybdenum-binding subunit